MKLSVRFIAGLLCMSLLGLAPYVSAQDQTTDKCIKDVYESLHREQLYYRSVIFGQKESALLPRSSVRFDTLSKGWIKTADDQWKSYASGSTTITRTDTEMDAQAYPPKRRGLIEIKTALTSEQIPPMLQALRALQCRLKYVCQAALQSRASATPATFRVKPDGCAEIEVNKFESCRDSQSLGSSTLEITHLNVQVGVCDAAAQNMLEREASVLTLALSYDASYRSFVQFAGIVQGFSDAFREPILNVLTDTVRTLQDFESVPCFSAQCDE
jgi:hypothetical protein